MPTVLVVDDEPKIAQLARDYLEHAGFAVLLAGDGNSAVQAASVRQPDLVVLDLGLPGIDGLEVMRRIRSAGSTPIVVLTARDTELDKLLGLELGADDYVTKPFSHRELVARIRAVLRRGQDVERHEVSVRGERVRLALKEFELLEMLLRNAGRVMTRGQLIDRIWGADYVGDTKTLDVHIKRLRTKIEPDPANPRYLITVRGLGYKFEA